MARRRRDRPDRRGPRARSAPPSDHDPSTPDRILAAAAELLVERDLHAVSTRAISERAGVNNALVHYHFGTRMALLVEAATRRFVDQLAEQSRLVRTAPSAGAGAAAAITWAATLDLRDHGVRLFVQLLAEAIRDPEARGPVAAALQGLREDLASAFADLGYDAQEAAAAATLLATMLDGVLLHHLIDPRVDFRPAAALAERAWPQSRPTPRGRGRRVRRAR